jgi:hypothetical protein
MERVTKQQLPDIVNYIKKVIMVDWAEVNFIIGTNPDSFIEVKFDQRSVDTELGLKAYMNTLLTTHEVISQFNLKRVLKFWGSATTATFTSCLLLHGSGSTQLMYT